MKPHQESLNLKDIWPDFVKVFRFFIFTRFTARISELSQNLQTDFGKTFCSFTIFLVVLLDLLPDGGKSHNDFPKISWDFMKSCKKKRLPILLQFFFFFFLGGKRFSQILQGLLKSHKTSRNIYWNLAKLTRLSRGFPARFRKVAPDLVVSKDFL